MSGVKFDNGRYRIVETPTKINDSGWFVTYTVYQKIMWLDDGWLLMRAGLDYEDALNVVE